MALGEEDISICRTKYEAILLEKERIPDAIDTFEYVVKNLSEWEGETTIGSEEVAKLKHIISNFTELNEQLKKYLQNIDEFLNKQESINQGSYT